MQERNVSVAEIELIIANPYGHILQSKDKAILYKKLPKRKDNLVAAVIVRLDKKGNVLGINITDSSQFFAGDDEITM